jgi:error-prone DNA polymerase
LSLLARAGGLSSFAGHRRQAHWSALGSENLPGALADTSAMEDLLPLFPPDEGEEILADYRSLGLTLGRHPLALLALRAR